MAKFVNKQSLCESLMENMQYTKNEAEEIVNFLFDEMSEALATDGKVDISGFGKFEIQHRKERKGINPSTMEPMMIPSSNVPKFRPSQTLKNKCNQED